MTNILIDEQTDRWPAIKLSVESKSYEVTASTCWTGELSSLPMRSNENPSVRFFHRRNKYMESSSRS
jgi:hypothetical protein